MAISLFSKKAMPCRAAAPIGRIVRVAALDEVHLRISGIIKRRRLVEVVVVVNRSDVAAAALHALKKKEISRNVFVQGENKENWSGFIVVAAEGRTYRSAGMTISDNQASLAPGIDRSPAFVADLSGDTFRITGNQLGPGVREFERRK